MAQQQETNKEKEAKKKRLAKLASVKNKQLVEQQIVKK